MQQRLTHIDIAKAIGLCLVILSHTTCPQLMFFAIGCFVPIFYITSGYTTKSIDIAKRAKRLLIPYVLFSAGLLLLYALQQGLSSNSLEEMPTALGGVIYSRYCFFSYGAAENITLLKAGNAPLWFLTSMFTAYLALVPLLKWHKWQAWIIGGYLILTFLLAQLPILLPWSIDCAPLMAIFIYCGMKMRDHNLLDNRSWLLWSAVFIGYCVITIINGLENLSVRDYGKSILLCLTSGLLGSMLLLKLSKWIEASKIGSYLAAIGRYSLTIFCLQMPLLIGARILINKTAIGLSVAIAPELVAIGQLLITLGVGYVLAIMARKLLPSIF